jgi:hypothetical protein
MIGLRSEAFDRGGRDRVITVGEEVPAGHPEIGPYQPPWTRAKVAIA